MQVRYDAPNGVDKVATTLVRWLAEAGVSLAGTRALRVRGRTTGRVRSVVVNVLTVGDVDYVVSPRGNTQWVRNVRAAGAVEMGRRRRRFQATEIDDAAKPELLKRYLDRWSWEVKGHMAGLTPDSGPDQIKAAAPSIPVFALKADALDSRTADAHVLTDLLDGRLPRHRGR